MSVHNFQDTDALLRILSTYSQLQQDPVIDHNAVTLQKEQDFQQSQKSHFQTWSVANSGEEYPVHLANSNAHSALGNNGNSPRLDESDYIQPSSGAKNGGYHFRQAHSNYQEPSLHYQQSNPFSRLGNGMSDLLDGQITAYSAGPRSGPAIAPHSVASPGQTLARDISGQGSLQDPRTIIDWPAGIRHVTKLVGRNAELGGRVKKASSHALF